MNWVDEAKRVFRAGKPQHFTEYGHCEECAEHDETLLKSSIDSIGLKELGNPGWDPICFCSCEGKKYYLPSFIRLTLETMADEFYFGQFLFHLEGDGKGNDFYLACSVEQRAFILMFVEYMIINHAAELENNFYENEAFKVQEIWSKA